MESWNIWVNLLETEPLFTTIHDPCVQYIPRNMHTFFALLCFVVVIHWLTFPYPSGLLHWHCGNLTIAPVPAKQPWWIWINTSCEFIMNDCVTTTKQSTTKPCAYFLGYTVYSLGSSQADVISRGSSTQIYCKCHLIEEAFLIRSGPLRPDTDFPHDFWAHIRNHEEMHVALVGQIHILSVHSFANATRAELCEVVGPNGWPE